MTDRWRFFSCARLTGSLSCAPTHPPTSATVPITRLWCARASDAHRTRMIECRARASRMPARARKIRADGYKDRRDHPSDRLGRVRASRSNATIKTRSMSNESLEKYSSALLAPSHRRALRRRSTVPSERGRFRSKRKRKRKKEKVQGSDTWTSFSWTSFNNRGLLDVIRIKRYPAGYPVISNALSQFCTHRG
jgi:hypothetical protein